MNPALITTLTTSIVAIVGAVTALVKAFRTDAKANRASHLATRAMIKSQVTETNVSQHIHGGGHVYDTRTQAGS